MKRTIIFIVIACISFLPAFAEDKKEPKVKASEYSLQVKISGIPKGQQTLFVPVKIDTSILDFDKVALEGIAQQNILAVASTSMDKVGTGIGLLKLDDTGLPSELELKVLLKKLGNGETTVSLLMVADEPALLAKGTIIYDGVGVNLSDNEIEVTEKVVKAKKKLELDKNKLTLKVTRPAQLEEKIFIPLIFDNKVFDLEETFGHAIIAPGLSAKTFSSGSLQEGGPGVEIVLGPQAEKDFDISIDLIPKSVGKGKIVAALPQKGHTALVRGTEVNINPSKISVVKKTTVTSN